ncbi:MULTISPECIES: hypothetical protein [unclassified Rhizobium]|uniref:hypothetical protein n=1 Tax=unclassified Rhizobium TaxID=2613769 RepID=UPI003807D0C5
MGEKKTRTALLVARHPRCTYCGGSAPTTSRDHCPPTSLFDASHRPAGLEFGACTECHEGTREIDQFIAMFSRLNPTDADDTRREELIKHTRSFTERYPELARKIFKPGVPILQEGRKRYLVAMDRDPRVDRIFSAFAARFSLALYRNYRGAPAPLDAKIQTNWLTNYDLDSDPTLDGFLEKLGGLYSLHQGKWHVADQFRFWAAGAQDDPSAFICFAGIRETFGFTAVLSTSTVLLDNEDTFSPGFLKGFRI